MPWFQFVEEVAEGDEGMDEEHAGADIAHDGPHLLAAAGGVAVDRTFPAARLAVAVRAMVEPAERILQKSAAVVAEDAVASCVVVAVAIDGYHPADHLLFTLDTLHIGFRRWIFPDGVRKG